MKILSIINFTTKLHLSKTTFEMDPNRKMTKKFTKKFDSKVINQQYLSKRLNLRPKIVISRFKILIHLL